MGDFKRGIIETRHKNWKLAFHIVFGLLPIASLSLSDDSQYCTEIKDERICYHLGSTESQNWAEAYKTCNESNTTLPVIRNVDEKLNLEKYLKEREVEFYGIWLSARWVGFQNWTWINGKEFQGTSISPLFRHEIQTNAVLKNDLSISSAFVCPFCSYLCQNDGQCEIGRGIQLTNSCLLIPNDKFKRISWYGARSECELKGGDLAVLENDDLKILKNDSEWDYEGPFYYIGLRKGSWFWMRMLPTSRGEEGDIEEVIYHNFEEYPITSRNFTENFCIFSRRSGLWESSSCAEYYSVICQRREPKHQAAIGTSVPAGQVKRNAFTITMTTVGALLFIAISVIVLLIIRSRKTSKRTVEPSADEQHQGIQRAQTVCTNRESNIFYEGLIPIYEEI